MAITKTAKVRNSTLGAPSKGELRRASVVEAIIHSLATKGIHHTTFESIGKAAKMKRSHLVYYFPNHDEMIRAAVDTVAKTAQTLTRNRLEAAQTAKERLLAIVDSIFEHMETNPKHAAVLAIFYHICTVDGANREMHTTFREVGTERLKGVIRELLPEKKDESECRRLAKAVQAILFGYLLEFITTNPDRSPSEMRSEARSTVFATLKIK